MTEELWMNSTFILHISVVKDMKSLPMLLSPTTTKTNTHHGVVVHGRHRRLAPFTSARSNLQPITCCALPPSSARLPSIGSPATCVNRRTAPPYLTSAHLPLPPLPILSQPTHRRLALMARRTPLVSGPNRVARRLAPNHGAF